MSIFTKIAAISTLVFSLGSASAITVSHTYNPLDIFMDVDGLVSGTTYTHSILDGFGVGGSYDPFLDTITSAILSVSVRDEGGNEIYTYKLDNISSGAFNGVPRTRTDVLSFGPGFVLSALDLDGMLNVVLTVTEGSFTFDSSTLEAQVTKGGRQQVTLTATAIPEPGSIAMVGLGLLGLAALRRKQVKR